MLHLNPDDVNGTLLRCARLLSEGGGGHDMGLVGSPSPGARLEKQVDLAWASKVVAVIDRDMDDLPKHWYRFVYTMGDIHVSYMRMFQHLRFGFVLDDYRADVVDNLVGLMTLAPWEMRHRALRMRGSLHSQSRIAELLGINQRNFKRTYRDAWQQMVVFLLEIGQRSEHLLSDRIASLVDLSSHHTKSVDKNAPLKIAFPVS